MSNKDIQETMSSEHEAMKAWIKKNGAQSQPIITGSPLRDPSSQEKKPEPENIHDAIHSGLTHN